MKNRKTKIKEVDLYGICHMPMYKRIFFGYAWIVTMYLGIYYFSHHYTVLNWDIKHGEIWQK